MSLTRTQYANVAKRISHLRRELGLSEAKFEELGSGVIDAAPLRHQVLDEAKEALTSAEVRLCELVAEIARAESMSTLLGGEEG